MDEVLSDIADVATCWSACAFKPNCAYYVHYALQSTCNLYLVSEGANYYSCDITRGPAGQSYDDLVRFFNDFLKLVLNLLLCFRDVVKINLPNHLLMKWIIID